MVFDASLGGLGASRLWTEMLTLGLPRSSIDEKAIGIQFGDSASQQIAEALAVLFRVCLAVDLAQKKKQVWRSSLMVWLTRMARKHTRSPQNAVVARELALTLSYSCVKVRPHVVKHTPGIVNNLADLLSRRFQLGVHFVAPQASIGMPEVPIRPRTGFFIVATDPRCKTGVSRNVVRFKSRDQQNGCSNWW